MTKLVTPKRIPIRNELFVECVPPSLIGSRDSLTGEVFFPAEAMNPTSMTAATLVQHEFDGAGTLVAWTVVGRGLPGFDSPYALGTIQLEAGPGLIAQLHDWQGKTLRKGMRVELVVERIKTDKDGAEIIGPKFVPKESF